MRRRDLVSLLPCLPAFAQYEESKGDVPWVPTPPEVIDTMFRMTGLNRRDTLYDLGSGDGRIVIAAAKKAGARGVGIEIEPHRVAEANAAAKAAGVEKRVKFVQQDLFQADFSGASVVTLYLFTAVIARLKPMLLKQLKPGSRIVSYQFNGMGDWKPDAIDKSNDYPVFYWAVPPRRS